MGITSEIKTISTSTLELLREDPLLVNTFLNAQWLPEYASWKEGYWSREDADKKKQEVRKGFSKPPLRQDWGVFFGMRQQWKKSYNWQVLEEQFLAEWETPELDLDKSWRQVTFLLAGYLPGGGDVHSQWKVPELIVDKEYDKDFLPFLVIENSKWDGLPLVNAVGAGAGIYCQRDYDPVRYLIPSEVDQILYGLLKLSRTGTSIALS